MIRCIALLLVTLCTSVLTTAQNVMSPLDGDYIYNPSAIEGSLTNPVPVSGAIQKWVHDLTQFPIGWNQSQFKSYRYNNISFRLRFPNNYDPSQKYPLVMYLHGGGEAALISNPHNSATVNRDNQFQLYVGAQLFEANINNGSFNGFLLLPQLLKDGNGAGAQWDFNTITPINDILDALEMYNGLDPDRVIALGISAGGLGVFKYAALYPKRIASIISASPQSVTDISSEIDQLIHIPIYASAGGQDVNPYPTTVFTVRDQVAAKGGDFYLAYYAQLGHGTWDQLWGQRDINNQSLLISYWNNASKAQPLVYYKNDMFCDGQPINAKMGITAGFAAYEWQRGDGGIFTAIAGATSNTYTATQTGSYRVRFKRTAVSDWSAWTPKPIVISTKACAVGDTAFAEHFEGAPVNNYVTFSGDYSGGNSPYFKYNTNCQNGIFVNSTQVFTQDASGRQGGQFMLNATQSKVGCEYFAGDQVWRTYYPATVTPNTDYTLTFYVANEGFSQGAAATPTVASLIPKINNVPLTAIGAEANAVGQLGWKKYSFNWNSGASTSAEIAITNNTATGTGNDFALDEISLVKAKPVPMPGGALKNVQLWTKGSSIRGDDGSPVGVWPNTDLNGNSLLQPLGTSQPVLETVGQENINGNPVTTYNPATNQFMFVPGGFAGNSTHQSVYAYLVTKSAANSQNAVLLREGPDAAPVMAATEQSFMKWADGTSASSFIQTAPGTLDTMPAIWSFSRSTNTTPSGNKTDIRKNGLVLANGNTAAPFISDSAEGFYINAFKINATTFLGSYGGATAELIYILDSNMTANKQSNIESYLALKYGTTLGNSTAPVNYTASDSTVYWPANATFQNDVLGIGTDSATALLQTSSNSVNTAAGDGSGLPAKGNLGLSAVVPLADKTFFVIGNDAAPLTQLVITAGSAAATAVGSTRLSREWKVANKGNIGAVNLAFDTTGLGNQQGGAVVNNYALMIDADGDGDFNTGQPTFFTATSALGKKIHFDGVSLADNAVFTIITLRANAALPATWLGFTAQAVSGNALLNWKTSDEVNVDRYVVEHSFDGLSFTAIGSVQANNNTGENNYSLTDNGLLAGSHYYRIRRVDKDGNTALSTTKLLKIAVDGAVVQIRPNPVTGSALLLTVAVQQPSKTMVKVMGSDGKILLQQKVSFNSGNNQVSVDLSNLPAGVYMLQMQLDNEILTKKFIRQR